MIIPRFGIIIRTLLASFALIHLAGCATTDGRDAELGPDGTGTDTVVSDDMGVVAPRDPLENWNRHVYAFNTFLDAVILRPVAWTYRTFIPSPLRTAVTNFLDNLNEPWVATNDLLQGEWKRAKTAMSRFFVNSTAGIGGLFDPATRFGLEKHDEDFDQTLAVWGIPSGPYLYLPVLGPSSPRAAFGFGVDAFAEPAGIAIDKADVNNLQLSRTLLEIIDARSRNWDAIEEAYRSEDPYATIRSAWRQNRRFQILNGRELQSPEEKDLFEQDFEIDMDQRPDGDDSDGARRSADDDGELELTLMQAGRLPKSVDLTQFPVIEADQSLPGQLSVEARP